MDPTQPLKLLIIEDSPHDAELMLDQLSEAGIRAEWRRVETESEYLASLDESVDLILADYTLPGFDAMRTLELLKQSGMDIPVLIVSGSVGEDRAVAAMRHGAADYLLKDRLARLGEAVKSALREKQLRDEKRSIEKSLHENEERFRAMFEQAAVGMAYADMKGRWLQVNQKFCDMLGYTAEEMLSSTFQSVTHPKDLADSTAHLQTLVDGVAQQYTIEKRYIRKDGRHIWVNLTVSMIHPLGGGHAYTSALIEDISERKRAEDQLRFHANLLNTVGQAVVATDVAGIVIYWNRFAETLYGWTADEAMGRNAAELITSDITQAQGVEVMRRVRQGQSWSGEYTVQNRAGDQLAAHVTLTPVYNDKGEVIATIGTSTDISERKQAEETLHKLSMAIEQTSDSVVISDIHGVIEYVNRAFERDTGISKAEAMGQQPYRLHFGQQSVEFYENIAKTVLSDKVYHTVMTNQRRNGEVYYEDATVSPIKNTDGVITNFVLIGRDITERLQLEQAEREQRVFAEALRDTASVLIETLEPEIVMSRVLENVERLGPHTAATILLIENGEARFTRWHNFPDDASALLKDLHLPLTVPAIEDMLENLDAMVIPNAANYSGWITYPELKWIRSLASTPIMVNGVLFGFLVLVSAKENFFDAAYTTRLRAFADQAALAIEKATLYTELRRHATELEARVKERTAELQIALEKERELGELKTRFISTTSHEFRTPLATIQITVDALRIYWEKMTAEDRQMRFQRVNDQIEHMTRLLEDVLTIGRAQSDRLDFNPAPLNLDGLCQEVIEELHAREQFHTLNYVFSGDPTPIYGDRKLLRQVIENLISNAIKYSPDVTPVKISLLREPDQVILSVQDHGIGIPEQDKTHLFEPFHRSSNVGTIPGTGLGLAIVKHAVELHGGEITLQSQPDHGSTFTVSLPIPKDPKPISDENPDPLIKGSAS